MRVGDFEPLPAIGHRRRRRASGYKSGHSKIVLLLALMFLLAGCDRIPTCKPGDQGTYIGDAIHTGGCPKQVVNDASGNVAVRR